MGKLIHEVSKKYDNGYKLCFQYYDFEGDIGTAYRFIWRTPSGSTEPRRGQTALYNIADIIELTSKAMQEGWGMHGLDNLPINNG